METAVRDRLDCVVGAVARPAPIPAGAAELAEITRSGRRAGRSPTAAGGGCRSAATRRPARSRSSSGSTRSRTGSSRRRSPSPPCARTSPGCSGTSTMEAADEDAVFGEPVTITVRVTDRDGRAGAGRAGVRVDRLGLGQPARRRDRRRRPDARWRSWACSRRSIRRRATSRCCCARRAGSGSCGSPATAPSTTPSVRFTRQEIAVLSRFQPPGTLVDLVVDVPGGAIVARPAPRVATVTVHVREPNGTTVRGVGSVQVRLRAVAARLGADAGARRVLERRGLVADRLADAARRDRRGNNTTFQAAEVTKRLPRILQTINDDTQQLLKQTLFTDATARPGRRRGRPGDRRGRGRGGRRAHRARDQPADRPVRRDQGSASRRGRGRGRARGRSPRRPRRSQAGFTQSAKQLFTTPPAGASDARLPRPRPRRRAALRARTSRRDVPGGRPRRSVVGHLAPGGSGHRRCAGRRGRAGPCAGEGGGGNRGRRGRASCGARRTSRDRAVRRRRPPRRLPPPGTEHRPHAKLPPRPTAAVRRPLLDRRDRRPSTPRRSARAPTTGGPRPACDALRPAPAPSSPRADYEYAQGAAAMAETSLFAGDTLVAPRPTRRSTAPTRAALPSASSFR